MHMSKMQNDLEECGLCRGEGSYPVADGAEDYQMEFCTCQAGRELEEQMAHEADEHHRANRDRSFFDYFKPQFDAIQNVQRELYRRDLV